MLKLIILDFKAIMWSRSTYRSYLFFVSLIFFTSCMESVSLKIVNDSKLPVTVQIISNEFTFYQDTFWHHEDQYFFKGEIVGTRDKFSMCGCRKDRLDNGKIPKIGFNYNEICYTSFDSLGVSKKLSFDLQPWEKYEIFYDRGHKMEGTSLQSVDTMYFRIGEARVELNGAQQIKAKVTKVAGHYELRVGGLDFN